MQASSFLRSLVKRLPVSYAIPTLFVSALLLASLLVPAPQAMGGSPVSYTGVCTNANLTAAPPSPQAPGTMVTLTGSATAPGHPCEFRFWFLPPNGSWTILRDYSTTATYAWDTTGRALGSYGLEVDARVQSNTNSYDSVKNITYVLSVTPCNTPTLTAAPPTPSGTGGTVVFTAGTSGCTNPQFRFWIQPPNGPWSVVQDYSSTNTYNWITTGTAGSYGVEVDVRALAEGNSVSYDAVKNITYVLNGCSAGNLSAAPPSPSAPGGTVVLTGSATCAGTPTYRFWIQQPGAPWTIVQNYSTSNTYNWLTAGLPLGTYGLEVDIRNQGATASYEAVGRLTYVLSVTPCTTPTLTAAPTSPGPTGGSVTFSASTSGCPNPRFRFWIQNPGGPWMILQDYSSLSSFVWTGTGMAGSYGVEVDVRDQLETSVSYDAVKNITYVLQGCSAASMTAAPPSTQVHGSPIVFTASATCLGTPEFRFWVLAPSGMWTVAQNYGASNTFSYTPATAGSYSFEVDVRNQGSNETYEKVFNINNYPVT